MKVYYQVNTDKRLLYAFAAFLVSFLFLPFLAFSANDDALFQSGTEITANGETLTVSESGAESLTVNSGDFTVNMPTGAGMSITSANRRTFTVSPSAQTESFTCGSASSVLILKGPPSGSGTITVTVTPASSGTCNTGGGGVSSGGSSSSSGGGGGGGGGASVTVAPKTTTTPAPVLGAAVGLSVAQAQSILNLLASFNADKSIIDAVRSVFTGKATTGTVAVSVSAPAGVSASFTRGLTVGSRGADVKRLQQLLNADPTTRIAASGAGAPGSETEYLGPLTTKAVEKFQVKYGVAKAGDPGYGYVGPKTRAKLLEVFK